jgi:hypothetical protein
MTRRDVTKSGKDSQGDITRLCSPGQYWSPRSKADAIRDIETGTNQYYVPWKHSEPSLIRVVNGPTGKYLRTDRDQTTKNNLDDLPDC